MEKFTALILVSKSSTGGIFYYIYKQGKTHESAATCLYKPHEIYARKAFLWPPHQHPTPPHTPHLLHPHCLCLCLCLWCGHLAGHQLRLWRQGGDHPWSVGRIAENLSWRRCLGSPPCPVWMGWQGWFDQGNNHQLLLGLVVVDDLKSSTRAEFMEIELSFVKPKRMGMNMERSLFGISASESINWMNEWMHAITN